MSVNDKIADRFKDLIIDAQNIGYGMDGVARDSAHVAECKAWMASALHIIELACPSEGNAYVREARKLIEHAQKNSALMPPEVQALRMLLERLQKDIDDGLLVSIENQATAVAFDDFLDHADEYLGTKQKNEASVIAGVVFEDTIRRVCQANAINEAGVKLDTLISNLAKIGKLSKLKAKHARAAASLRTSATHAQ